MRVRKRGVWPWVSYGVWGTIFSSFFLVIKDTKWIISGRELVDKTISSHITLDKGLHFLTQCTFGHLHFTFDDIICIWLSS